MVRQNHPESDKSRRDISDSGPADLNREAALIAYTLHLADNALVTGHRNSEWTGHGPILEQDIAISNIALDLIGQARNFYQYAARLINQVPQFIGPWGDNLGSLPGTLITEDNLAYFRDSWDFKNCLLAEQPRGDWAMTILRQFFFSTYQYYLYADLQISRDHQIAAISEKAFKEAAYHLQWSSEWVVRLGDGTNESHIRMQQALDILWPFTGELFQLADYEQYALSNGLAADGALIKSRWERKVEEIFAEAMLAVPRNVWMQSGGKQGRHTEQLGYLLAEMQSLQRAYPGNEW